MRRVLVALALITAGSAVAGSSRSNAGPQGTQQPTRRPQPTPVPPPITPPPVTLPATPPPPKPPVSPPVTPPPRPPPTATPRPRPRPRATPTPSPGPGIGADGGSSEIFQLDAGSLISPLLPGFARVHREGSSDDRVRWTSPPTAAFSEDFPDPLVTDGVEGGVLHLDAAAGTWDLWLQIDPEAEDPLMWTSPADVRVNGRTVWSAEPITDAAGFFASERYAPAVFPTFLAGESSFNRQIVPHHPWRRVQVTLDRPGLDVQVVGRPLLGLVAAPTAARAEAEVALALADGHRRSWFELHHRPPMPGHARDEAPLALSPTAFDGLPGAPAEAWTVTAAPTQLIGGIVWARGAGEAVQVRLDGFDRWKPELFEVHWLDAGGHPDRPERPRPAFLRPIPADDDGWSAVRGDQGAPVGVAWVARLPADATSDLATLRVQSDGSEARLALSVDVIDVSLPPAPVPTGFFVQADQAAAAVDGAGSNAVLARFERDIAWIRRLGMPMIALRHALWPDRAPAPDHPGDPTVLSAFAERWAAAGGATLVWSDAKARIRKPAFTQGGEVVPAPWQDPFTRTLDAAGGRSVAVLAHLYDEEGGFKRLENVARGNALAAAARALGPPGLRTVAAAHHPADWATRDGFDVVMLSDNPPLSAAAVAHVRAAGAEAWAYNLSPGRSSAWHAWAAGVTGHLQWHWSPQAADPFDLVRDPAPWTYAFHAPNGETWVSPLALAFAQGVEDTRWLAALEAKVQRAEMSRRRPDRDAAAAGRAVLDAARATLDGAAPQRRWDGEVLAPEALAATLAEVIRLTQDAPRRPGRRADHPRRTP